jgi:hypothetical protein
MIVQVKMVPKKRPLSMRRDRIDNGCLERISWRERTQGGQLAQEGVPGRLSLSVRRENTKMPESRVSREIPALTRKELLLNLSDRMEL